MQTSSILRYCRAAAAVLVLTGTTACDALTGLADGSCAGDYRLVEVNGQSLPIQQGGGVLQSGSINLRTDGTWESRLVASTGTFERQGTWTEDDGTVRIVGEAGAEPGVGTCSDGELLFESGGFITLYEKR